MIQRRPGPGNTSVLTVALLACVLLAAACTSDPATDSSQASTTEADSVDATDTVDATDDAVDAVNRDAVYRTVEIINTYPHDPTLFTQGLEFVDNLLVESAGKRGQSSIRIYDPLTGAVVADQAVDDALFAEGAAVVDDKIWQLTWQAEKALIYEVDGLELIDEVAYQGEGWGLCLLHDQFVMSNGSDQLTFRRTTDFSPLEVVTVNLDDVGPISQLNELECVADGERSTVWANVWKSNTIYGIDPATGNVTDVVDAAALVPPGYGDDTDRVLNGIAFHSDSGRFWLTGKEWPVLYEVEFSGP